MRAQATVRVQPRSRREGVAGRIGAEWKVQVTAPPVEGKANEACVGFFARGLRVPRSAVRIVSGAASRHKRIEIDGIAQEALDGFLSAQAAQGAR